MLNELIHMEILKHLNYNDSFSKLPPLKTYENSNLLQDLSKISQLFWSK